MLNKYIKSFARKKVFQIFSKFANVLIFNNFVVFVIIGRNIRCANN